MAVSFLRLAKSLVTGKAGGDSSSASGRLRNGALLTGAVAVGAAVAGAVAERVRRSNMPQPSTLPPSIDAPVHGIEVMEGTARYYFHPGTGVPIVLLHSINAAGSSFEMKPIFEHLRERSDRPIYALDWLGFGLSDRPAARYSPGLYQRQLRRFLSEHVREAADVVALSLGSEYATTVANAFPVLVRRLVLISPTGTGESQNENVFQRALEKIAGTVGAFDVFFTRLTRRESLRQFYADHVFEDPTKVPAALVEYAYLTTRTNGAQHAPRRFIQGVLSMHEYAPRAYEALKVPTLLIIPDSSPEMVQDFVRAPQIAAANAEHVTLGRVRSGLVPQWEDPDLLFAAIDSFLQLG